MQDRIKQKLIAEKKFFLTWLDIVLKASDFDLEAITLNYDKIKKAIDSNWEGILKPDFYISLDFYNYECLYNSIKFKDQVFRIKFIVSIENNWLELEIRKYSTDIEGFHCCIHNEEYLLHSGFNEKEELTSFFNDSDTKRFLEIYDTYQKIYPNPQLPDIDTDIDTDIMFEA